MGIKFKNPGKTILLLMIALGGFYYVLRNISISELIGSLEKIRSVYFFTSRGFIASELLGTSLPMESIIATF